ncbi:MAG: type II 3-dehydroquinate dehydratase [Gemmatimonadales bacterium]
MRVGVINGPNLNLLGSREPALYGGMTLGEIESLVRVEAGQLGIAIDWFQSNHEGELVDAIQRMGAAGGGLLVNAGGYTHTSLAVRDAIAAVPAPCVEIHLTNIFGRESVRRRSLLAEVSVGVIAGFGPTSYLLGLRALHARLADA